MSPPVVPESNCRSSTNVVEGATIKMYPSSNVRVSRLGAELMRVRRAAGRSREEVAQRVGVTSGYVAALEQGKRRPSPQLMAKLGDTLAAAPEQLTRLLVCNAVDSVADQLGSLHADDLVMLELLLESLLSSDIDAEAVGAQARLRAALASFQRPDDAELQAKLARHFLDTLASVVHRWDGSVWLSVKADFDEITLAMRRPELTAVSAVNTIDPRRWLEEPRELAYLNANADAAGRQALIRRLFIVDADVNADDLARVEAEQRAHGITHLKWLSWSAVSTLADRPEDTVLFNFDDTDQPAAMYVGHGDPEDVLRVEFGERVTNTGEIDRFGQYFDRMFASAHDEPGRAQHDR